MSEVRAEMAHVLFMDVIAYTKLSMPDHAYFRVGEAAGARYFAVVEICTTAARLRATGK